MKLLAMKHHIVDDLTERYGRTENVVSTVKYFRYALHFNPFKFKKREGAMCPVLKASHKKRNCLLQKAVGDFRDGHEIMKEVKTLQ